MRKPVHPLLFVAAWATFGLSAARADFAPVATYAFQNTLAARQSGVASLTAVDPQGTSGFATDTLYGQTRQVYQFIGNTTPAQQAGLSLNTTGLISSNNYSVSMVFEFTQNDAAWRRILDVQNRQSDNGFYVDPSNHLDVYPVSPTGTTAFTENVYHDVVLTVSGAGQVIGYLDGVQEFSTTTAVMNISNPGNLMNFFLDNTVGGGQGEYSSGKIGLIQVYGDVLTAGQVATQAANPFAGTAVPEPSSLLMVGSAALIGLGYRLRSRRKTAKA